MKAAPPAAKKQGPIRFEAIIPLAIIPSIGACWAGWCRCILPGAGFFRAGNATDRAHIAKPLFNRYGGDTNSFGNAAWAYRAHAC